MTELTDVGLVRVTALNRAAREVSGNGAFGVITRGVGSIELLRLLSELQEWCTPYLSLVGYEPGGLERIREQLDLTEAQLGVGATHAVGIRNSSELESDALRLILAKSEEVRLHSVTRRGYVSIGSHELMRQVCLIAQNQAPNEPHESFWRALMREELLVLLSLDELVSFVEAVFSQGPGDLLEAPRELLPRIGLFRDPSLLTSSYRSEQRIAQRLVRNADTVEQIQRGDEKDRKQALLALRTAEDSGEGLKRAYKGFLRLAGGDLGAVTELTLPEALTLLAGEIEREQEDEDDDESDEDDQPESEEESRQEYRDFTDLELATIELVKTNERELLDAALTRAFDAIHDDPTSTIEITEGDVRLLIDPSQAALSLGRRFERALGLVFETDEVDLDELIEHSGRHLEVAEEYGDAWLATLKEYLKRAGQLVEGFEGVTLLEEYLHARKQLIPAVESLACAPLAAITTSPEGDRGLLNQVTEAVDAFQRLTSHLEEYYLRIKKRSPEGALRIYSDILRLDSATLHASDDIGVVLSPLNPLVLWKYLELSRLLTDGPRPAEPEDLEMLAEVVQDLPEPLLVYHNPSVGRDGGGLNLTYVRRIGSLPIYRPSRVEGADISEQTFLESSKKLAALYPPVREWLRIVLIDPIETRSAARAVSRLLERDNFKKVSLTLSGVEKRRSNAEIEVDAVLDQAILEGSVEVRREGLGSLEEMAKYLAAQPAHLVALSGLRQRYVSKIEREGTRLHPLSFPTKIEADPITGTVSLRPRSVEPPEDITRHPFGIYHSLVSLLTDSPRTESSLSEHRPVPIEDYHSVADGAEFVLVPGIPSLGEDEEIISLTQGVSLAGDSVLTRRVERIRQGLKESLLDLNYQPTKEGLDRLLAGLQQVGGEGLFSTISESSETGFSGTALRGQLGMAVALSWYKKETTKDRQVLLSLDSYLARRWLRKRDTDERSDLLGFRQSPDGQLHVDVIEVKSYQATTESSLDDSSPVRQLMPIARTLETIFGKQGELLVDRRRELLRLQMYREGLIRKPEVDPDWVTALNEMLDGEAPVELNLKLIELAFDQNLKSVRKRFEVKDPETVEDRVRSVERIRLGEEAIQAHLSGMLERAQTSLTTETQGEDEQSDRLESITEGEDAYDPDQETAVPKVAEFPDKNSRFATERNSKDATTDTSDVGEQTGTDSGEDLGLAPTVDEEEWITETAHAIYRILQDLGVSVAQEIDPEEVEVGPSVARFKIRLRTGEKVSALTSRARDLMRELAVEKEPIVDNLPGTRFVYIDLPRPDQKPAFLRSLLDTNSFQESIRGGGHLVAPLGVTPAGEVEYADLTDLPHMLVAGSTGSGKTMFLYALALSLIHAYSPQELELIVVDPKQTDFVFFNGVPHLKSSQHRVITDPEEAISILLGLLSNELNSRTELLTSSRSRDLRSYNEKYPEEALAPIVVIIDEFADLSDVMSGKQREEFDSSLRRLAQRARNVGIHLIVATQRPTADIVNGTLKSNLPCRVSFRLASNVDSRTILDRGGAEHLLGNGDMLVARGGEVKRLQGLFTPETDIEELLNPLIDEG